MISRQLKIARKHHRLNAKRTKKFPHLESLEKREVLDASFRLDFGTAGSPLATGFTQITDSNRFDAALGYGWTKGDLFSRDRGGVDAGLRDFVGSSNASFALNLAAGTYNVTLSLSDPAALHDQDIYLEGQRVDSPVVKAGDVYTRTYTVAVTDGQLNLDLNGLGGQDGTAILNSMVVTNQLVVAPTSTFRGSYDFGTNSSPVAAGAYRVTPTTVRSANFAAGNFGWKSGAIEARDRNGSDAALRDFNLTRDGTFGVVVPNGTYSVTVTMGDANAGHDMMSVYLEGSRVDSVTTSKGRFFTKTYTVNVTDGELTLRLQDIGGTDANAVINFLDVVSVGTPPPVPVSGTFGNGGAVTEGSTGNVSFTNVTGGSGRYTYSYDFNNDGTFEVAGSSAATAVVPSSFLADGPFSRIVRGVVTDSAGVSVSYTTTIQVTNVVPTVQGPGALSGNVNTPINFTGTASDPSAADAATLTYQWDFGDGTTASGATVSHAYTTAGTFTARLTVTDKDGGSAIATTSVTVTVPTPPPVPGPIQTWKYDFGTATSALTEGFTRVDPSTAFTTTQGYGWITGSVDSRARSVGSSITHDFNFGQDATFAVNMPNGTYTVTITLGDSATAHDQMAVFLQGTQVDNVDTPMGQFVTRSYSVTVSDGQLRLGLRDMGGTDGLFVLNSLQVTPPGIEPEPLPPEPIPQPNPTPGPGETPPPNDVPTSPRPTAGFIVTPAGYIPDWGANPTIVSARSGAWTDVGTWTQGRVPGVGDVVVIGAGVTVTYDVYSTSAVNTVVVQAGGHLVFRTDMNTRLTVQNLLVMEQGELQIGTLTNPVAANAKAEVIFADLPLNTVNDPEQFGGGLIGLGKVTVYGKNKGQSFIRLANEALAGSTTITLSQPATNWNVGDKLFFPDTRQLNNNTAPGGDQFSDVGQLEMITIAAISTDGRTITLNSALRFDHKGARAVDGTLTFLPHVGNMTRNVAFRSQNNFGTRGHTLFTGKADIDIHNAAFQGLGRSTINTYDSTTFDANWNVSHVGTNQIGRYPVQFKHLVGPTGGQVNGRQFTFEDNAVVCQMTPQPFRWGIAIDDSHYGSVQNNLLYNWRGAGIAVVSGGETENIIANNFITHTRGINAYPNLPNERTFTDVGYEGVGLWVRSYTNRLNNNVVNDSPQGILLWNGDATNYHRRPAFQGADTFISSQTVMVDSLHVPITEFVGNEVYGGDILEGLAIWRLNSNGNTPYLDAAPSVIRDFKVWHVFGKAYYGYMTSNLTFDGLVARGDAQQLIQNRGGPLGVYWGGHYGSANGMITNSDIQGFKTGVEFTAFGQQQTIQNSFLSNYHNLSVLTRDQFLPQDHTQSRRIDINNVRFARINMPDIEGLAPQAFISMRTRLDHQQMNVTGLDQVFVTNFNGVQGDNFRVYYQEQAANNILPQTIVLPNGVIDLFGAPVPGLTNQQAWTQYQLAWAGEVAPTNSTTRANVNGLVFPF